MDYLAAKRELLNQEAAKAAREEAIAMLARAALRDAAPQDLSPAELNQKSFDVTRIAYIAARVSNDGYQSDVFLVPETPDAPVMAFPCPLNTVDAVVHYNKLGKGAVKLTHAVGSRVAVNITNVSQLKLTPDAITSALVYWTASDGQQGLPVRLSDKQIMAIQTKLDLAQDIAVSQLRAVAEQSVLKRRPHDAKSTLAAG